MDDHGGANSGPATEAPPIAPSGANADGRRPWIAGLLALFVTPVGFAYVGRLGTGLALVAAMVAVLAIFGWTGAIQTVAGFAVFFCTIAILFGVQVALAWSVARRHRLSYRPRRYNRWYVYVLIALLFQMLKVLVLENRADLFGYATYRIATSSMADTLVRGDLVVVDARPQALRGIGRHDVVVYRDANGKEFVRRVAGMPGETVLVGAGGVIVDGGALDEPDSFEPDSPARRGSARTITLGPDEYFLIGDDREWAHDSRAAVPIRAETIRGRASAIVYSSDLARIGPLH